MELAGGVLDAPTFAPDLEAVPASEFPTGLVELFPVATREVSADNSKAFECSLADEAFGIATDHQESETARH